MSARRDSAHKPVLYLVIVLVKGYVSALKERGRDFFGCLLLRAEFSANFYDASQGGGYASAQPLMRSDQE
jgi:hypothetical protein